MLLSPTRAERQNCSAESNDATFALGVFVNCLFNVLVNSDLAEVVPAPLLTEETNCKLLVDIFVLVFQGHHLRSKERQEATVVGMVICKCPWQEFTDTVQMKRPICRSNRPHIHKQQFHHLPT